MYKKKHHIGDRKAGPEDQTHPLPQLGDGALFQRPKSFPALFGNYELIEEMPSGGMSWLYLAIERSSGKKVVVKTPNELPPLSPDITRRFRREIQSTGGVDVPGVIRLHSSGVVQGMPYLVTRYVEGVSGGQVLTNPEIPLEQRLQVFSMIVDIVAKLHGAGQFHRDLKPSNILVEDGRPVILDLGLAKSDAEETIHTITGDLPSGTIPYMPPESLRGEQLPPGEIDVYALGVMLCEVLTGERPYAFPGGCSIPEQIGIVLSHPPRWPSQISPVQGTRFDAVVARALHPHDRCADASGFATMLDQSMDGSLDAAAPISPESLVPAAVVRPAPLFKSATINPSSSLSTQAPGRLFGASPGSLVTLSQFLLSALVLSCFLLLLRQSTQAPADLPPGGAEVAEAAVVEKPEPPEAVVRIGSGDLEGDRAHLLTMDPPQLPAWLAEGKWDRPPSDDQAHKEGLDDLLRGLQDRVRFGSVPKPKPSLAMLKEPAPDAHRHQRLAGADRDAIATLFAMRRHLDPRTLWPHLDHLPENEHSRQARSWFLLLAHDHGVPFVLHSNEAWNGIHEVRKNLDERQREWVRRCAASDDPWARRHGRMWEALLLGEDPSRSLSHALDNALAEGDGLRVDLLLRAYRRSDQAGLTAFATARLNTAQNTPETLAAFDLLHYAVYGGATEKGHDNVQALAPIAAYLDAADRDLRRGAAISLLPSAIDVPVRPRLAVGRTTHQVFAMSPAELSKGLEQVRSREIESPFLKTLLHAHPWAEKNLDVVVDDVCTMDAAERMSFQNRLPNRFWGFLHPWKQPPAEQARWFHNMALERKSPQIIYHDETFMTHDNQDFLDLIRVGATHERYNYLPLANWCPTNDNEGVRTALAGALDSPSLMRRMHAARSLALLGDPAHPDVLRARDAALEVLNRTDAPLRIKGRAGLVLAASGHQASRGKRYQIWQNALPPPEERFLNDSKNEDCLDLARAMLAARDDPRMKEYVAERIRTMDCGNHEDKVPCHRCATEAHVLAAMMWEWKTAFPVEAKLSRANGPVYAASRQMALLFDEENQDWPTSKLWAVLLLPDEPRIDISRETAQQLDALAGEGNRFRKAANKGHRALLAEYGKFYVELKKNP